MIIPQNLRTRLALLMLLAFVPILALIVLSAYAEQGRRLAEIEVYEQRLASATAATYAQAIERAHDVLRVLAHMPQVRRLDGPGCNAIIADLAGKNSQYANFGVARTDGQVICNGTPVINIANVGATQAFRRAMQSGDFSVGGYVVSPVSGRPILGLALPVRDEAGAIIGVAGALLSVDWLNSLADENLLPAGGTLSVVDQSGRIVVRKPDPDKWVGQLLQDNERLTAAIRGDSWYEGKTAEGEQRGFALSSVKGIPPPAGLYVSATTDPRKTVVAIQAELYRDLVVLLIAAVLAFALAWFGTEYSVLRRVNVLLAATRGVATGKLDARAGMASGPTELRQLGAAFDDMAEALQQREQAMDEGRMKLVEQESLLRSVLELLPVGVWIVGPDGKIVSGNREAQRIWGGEKRVGIEDYGLFKSWWHGTDRSLEAHERSVTRALRNGEISSNVLFDIESFDGVHRTIANWAVPIRDIQGRIVGAISVNQEITERIRAESELIASEGRFRTLFDNAPDTIIVAEPDGAFIDINNSGLVALGYTREELVGMNASDIVTATDVPRVDPELADIRSGKPYVREWTLRRKDGSTFDGEIYGRLMPNGKLLGIVRDITERKRAQAARETLEAQLRQSQKMEALGTLAGGIAHDFNNILGAIIGNVELARQDVDTNHAAQVSLTEIRNASHRARDLVRQILIFSRQQPQERRIIQLRDVVEESVKLLRATLPAGVELHLDCPANTPNVLADRTQIHQVLMNLCTNAWHAMNDHAGHIDISLANAFIQGDSIHVDLPPGSYTRITVQDNGKGMEPTTLERIFDPFFTTKDPGAGTGLGLAVVDGVMKNHDGVIVVHSALGIGTTFDLYFPAVVGQVEAPREVSPILPRGQRQRILYLDDEEPLVLLASRFLGRLGYEVKGCTRAEEALAIFRADPTGFDLLVTDLNMPGASGLDVAREFLQQRPDLPVALASGYVTEALREKAKALGVREVIYKPNTAEDMAQTIHRLLRDMA